MKPWSSLLVTVWFVAIAACSDGKPAATDIGIDRAPDIPVMDIPRATDIPDVRDLRETHTADAQDLADDGSQAEISDLTAEVDTPGLQDLVDSLAEVDSLEVEDGTVELEGLWDESGEADAEVCGQGCTTPDPVWAKSMGGTGYDKALAITVDLQAFVTVGGHTSSPQFSVDDEMQGNIENGGPAEVFVTRLSKDGQPVWTKFVGSPADDRLRAIASDSKGNVIIGGFTFGESFDFDGQVEQSAGKMDGYVAVLSPAGEVNWARLIGANDDEVVLGLAADGEDNVLLGGYFRSPTLDLGTGPIHTFMEIEQYDALIAKLDDQGETIWARGFGGYGSDYVHSMAVDAEGRVYVAGGMSSVAMKFGDTQLDTAGESDIWVGCLSADGEPQWAHRYGGEAHDAAHTLTVSPEGDVYVTGSFQSMVVNFGGGPIEHVGSPEYHDIFLLRLTPEGNHVWSLGFGGTNWDLAKSVALAPDNTLYMTGGFNSKTLSVGGEPLTGAGLNGNQAEVLLAAYTTDGAHLWSTSYGGPDSDIAYWIAAGADGTVAVTGTFNGTEGGNPSGTMTTPLGPLTTMGGRDSFVIRVK